MIEETKNLVPNKPDIITNNIECLVFSEGMDPEDAVFGLRNGQFVLVDDDYQHGQQILEKLKFNIQTEHPQQDYKEQRKYRSKYREASHQLLVSVINDKIPLLNAPKIGWLQILYPKHQNFFISYPSIQGLNSSWQWYKKGMKVDVVDIQIHPYYGVYFPTRFEHLHLFHNWIKRYKGPKEFAFDVGIGSGILSFILLRHGFKTVIGTDINKNAIIGAKRERSRLGYENRLFLKHGELFADIEKKSDVIVFNPPWLIASKEIQFGIDKAIYYKSGLFRRFFDQAEQRLHKNGKLIMLFSNLGEVTKVNQVHPIKRELMESNRFINHDYHEKPVETGSKRNISKKWKRLEKVELWILKLNPQK